MRSSSVVDKTMRCLPHPEGFYDNFVSVQDWRRPCHVGFYLRREGRGGGGGVCALGGLGFRV